MRKCALFVALLFTSCASAQAGQDRCPAPDGEWVSYQGAVYPNAAVHTGACRFSIVKGSVDGKCVFSDVNQTTPPVPARAMNAGYTGQIGGKAAYLDVNDHVNNPFGVPCVLQFTTDFNKGGVPIVATFQVNLNDGGRGFTGRFLNDKGVGGVTNGVKISQ
jgi:hypothetical protein